MLSAFHSCCSHGSWIHSSIRTPLACVDMDGSVAPSAYPAWPSTCVTSLIHCHVQHHHQQQHHHPAVAVDMPDVDVASPSYSHHHQHGPSHVHLHVHGRVPASVPVPVLCALHRSASAPGHELGLESQSKYECVCVHHVGVGRRR